MSEPAVRTVGPRETDSFLWRIGPWLALAWIVLYWVMFFSVQLPNNPDVTRLDVIRLLRQIYLGLLTPVSSPQSPAGWPYLWQRVEILGCASLILATALCAGRMILRGVNVFQELDRPTRLALSGGLGFSALSLFTLFCGWLGFLWRPLFIVIWGALIVLETALSFRGIRDSRRFTRAAGQESRPPRGGGRGGRDSERDHITSLQKSSLILHPSSFIPPMTVAICIPFVTCMLLGAMLPPTDFDVKEYHLQGPKEFFLDGRVHFLPHNVYTSFPFLTEMLSLAAMVLRNDWFFGALVGQTVLMTFAPLTALGVYCVGRRLAGEAAGWLGAMCYLTAPWSYRISIIAYTEGALCCYVILTLLAFLVWWETCLPDRETGKPARSGALFILGFFAGSAVSTKYPGMVLVTIPFAVAIGIAACRRKIVPDTPSDRDNDSRSRSTILSLLLYTAGVLAAFGPWMAKNLAETGNPVYPLMYSVFGGRDWNSELNEKWRHAHGPPPDLFRGFLTVVDGMAVQNDWQSPLLFGLAPLALLWRRRGVAAVGSYSLVILAVWFLLTHRIDRFWAPVNPVLAVLAGCGLAAALPWSSRAPDRTSFPKLGIRTPDAAAGARRVNPAEFPVAAGVPVLALIAFAVIFNFGFVTTGLCGYNAYLIDYAASRRLVTVPSIALIQSLNRPPTARVLFVGEAQVFDAEFSHRYNTVFDDSLLEAWTSKRTGADEWELFSPDEIRRNLQAQGITHVFINWNEIVRYRLTYGYTDFVNPGRIRELAALANWRPVPLPTMLSERDWNQVGPAEQALILQWGPRLKTHAGGAEKMIQFEMFEVPQSTQ